MSQASTLSLDYIPSPLVLRQDPTKSPWQGLNSLSSFFGYLLVVVVGGCA